MDWTLNDALALVRAIQPKTRDFNYHLALGGGVLNTGKSKKDVDLYFLPLDNQKGPSDSKGLVEWLSKQWGTPEAIGGDYGEEPAETPQTASARWREAARQFRARRMDTPPPTRWFTVDEAPVATSNTTVVPNNQWHPVTWDNNIAYAYPTMEPTKTKESKQTKAYSYKLKFVREIDNARIDVFIV